VREGETKESDSTRLVDVVLHAVVPAPLPVDARSRVEGIPRIVLLFSPPHPEQSVDGARTTETFSSRPVLCRAVGIGLDFGRVLPVKVGLGETAKKGGRVSYRIGRNGSERGGSETDLR
jgi:hypothetical protein